MIDKSLEILGDELNSYLKKVSKNIGTTTKAVELCPVTKADGATGVPQNTVGLSLVGVEEEKVLKAEITPTRDENGQYRYQNPELRLNLYILIAANFNEYKSSLENLSAILRHFQSKHVFTRQNTPEMDASIKRLQVELYSLTFEQQNHLWGSIGGKYLPSVLYKVRMLSIQEGSVSAVHSPIFEMDFEDRSV